MNDATYFHTGRHAGVNEPRDSMAHCSPETSEQDILPTGCYKEISGRAFREMAEHLMEIEFTEDVDEDDCPYGSAADFLQGSCQLFSLALHQAFGFEAF